MTQIEVKKNDVFRFRFNEAELKRRAYPYHCFDGTLRATEISGGTVILLDTYWSGISGNRSFSVEEALSLGSLEFVCNLDEVEPATQDDAAYFDDEDMFILVVHAGHRNEYYRRRGAERSPAKMLSSLDEKISEAESDIRYAQNRIDRLRSAREAVEAGRTDVYF